MTPLLRGVSCSGFRSGVYGPGGATTDNRVDAGGLKTKKPPGLPGGFVKGLLETGLVAEASDFLTYILGGGSGFCRGDSAKSGDRDEPGFGRFFLQNDF